MCETSSVAAMAPIATYVFLDLGTTGLDTESNEITELSMVAVDRQQFLDSISQEIPEIPKFVNKLTRCFKPETRKISYPARADGTGGFTEEMLQGELPLNESCFHLIDKFLCSLARPVCIIAHYGFQSDYLILKRYFTKLQVQFSSELVCVDSHQMCYDILEEKKEEKYIEEYFEQYPLTLGNSSRPINRGRDIYRDATFELIRQLIPKILKIIRTLHPSLSSCNPLPKQDASNLGNSSKLSNNSVTSSSGNSLLPSCNPLPGQDASYLCNSTIPTCNPVPGQDASNAGNSSIPSSNPLPGQDASNISNSSIPLCDPVSGQDTSDDFNEITELKLQLRKLLTANRRRFEKDDKRAKRQYPWGPEQNMPGVSYGLPETYTRVFKRKPRDAHKAEVDCILMLEIAVELGQDFLDWVDDETNQLPFPSLTKEVIREENRE
ncbi:uncharacterized protein LOC133524936 [Cydia pomonella]|uniref:uncharacterized protein LOC133524936 n=1 Tax=Cydia pomonella TaxID=82600 RepID=UPI002ADDE3C5|nr:uncharacterized protein LOC133524936 [Cydia pomonella]